MFAAAHLLAPFSPIPPPVMTPVPLALPPTLHALLGREPFSFVYLLQDGVLLRNNCQIHCEVGAKAGFGTSTIDFSAVDQNKIGLTFAIGRRFVYQGLAFG